MPFHIYMSKLQVETSEPVNLIVHCAVGIYFSIFKEWIMKASCTISWSALFLHAAERLSPVVKKYVWLLFCSRYVGAVPHTAALYSISDWASTSSLSFSPLSFLFGDLSSSGLYILESAYQVSFMKNISGFRLALHWIYRTIWNKCTFIILCLPIQEHSIISYLFKCYYSFL